MIRLFIILFVMTHCFGSDVVVIKSQECTAKEISKTELKYLFLGVTTVHNNQDIVIYYNQKEKLQANFFESYMDKTPMQMKMYWTKMIYTGKKHPPQMIDSDELKKIGASSVSCMYTFVENDKIAKGWSRIDVVER